MSFSLKRKFNGEIYKLATLHKGVTKSHANKTKKINIKSGNKARIVKQKRKYATYVRK